MIELLEETKRAVRRPVKSAAPHIRLLRDNVLVRMDTEATLHNGLWYPGSVRRDDDAFHACTVIACGPGTVDKQGRFHATSVAPGDRVLVFWFALENGKGHGGPSGVLRPQARQSGKYWNNPDEVIIRESDISVILES